MNDRYVGVMRAATSIAHGGESLGTVRYLRRERIQQPDGTVEEVPIISGNMLRGVLRRTAADAWWVALGKPRLTAAVAHAIWSGGALARSGTEPLAFQRLQDLQRVCPVVGLFGSAGGGRIVNGAVNIGKAIPLCTETAHLVPPRHREYAKHSLWEMTQIEYYSRHPSTPPELADEEQHTSGLMRFGVETFHAGSLFSWTVSTSWANESEQSLLMYALHELASGAQPIGGLTAAGLGVVHVDWDTPLPTGVTHDGRWVWEESLDGVSTTEALRVLADLN